MIRIGPRNYLKVNLKDELSKRKLGEAIQDHKTLTYVKDKIFRENFKEGPEKSAKRRWVY